MGDEGPGHKLKERNESGWIVGEVETLREKKCRGRREAAGDDTTSRSMKEFQFEKVSNAKKGKPSGRGMCAKGSEKSFIRKREGSLEGPHDEAEIQRRA